MPEKRTVQIGLSKARRAGVPLSPPRKGRTKEKTRLSAERAYEIGQGLRKPRAPSSRRGKAVRHALDREPKGTVSKSALAEQAKRAATERHRRGKVRGND